jgi:hypothetical protein
MRHTVIALAVVSLVAASLVLAAGAATAAAPPPPPHNGANLLGEWTLKSLIGNKKEYGSLDLNYQVASQTLSWTLDYKGTTGPATDLRMRMLLANGHILSLTMCRPGCKSVARTNVRGPYFHLQGTIVRPPRDLVLMATRQASADVILATAQYPRGELRDENESFPTAGGTGGGHCC